MFSPNAEEDVGQYGRDGEAYGGGAYWADVFLSFVSLVLLGKEGCVGASQVLSWNFGYQVQGTPA